MSAEEWRRIPGFSDYEASDRGRLRSWKVWHGQPGPRLMSQSLGNRGYLVVSVMSDAGVKTKREVHTLVAAAFCGPRPEGQEVRHLNGDRLDNRRANLTWGTRAENCADMFLHGTHPTASKTHCKNGHPFDSENTRVEVYEGRPRRKCITCLRAYQRAASARYYAKKKAS